MHIVMTTVQDHVDRLRVILDKLNLNEAKVFADGRRRLKVGFNDRKLLIEWNSGWEIDGTAFEWAAIERYAVSWCLETGFIKDMTELAYVSALNE